MGTGGVGGYFGALLAKAGHEVTFIARGTHLEAIRSNGLTVESDVSGKFCVHSHATDQLSDVDPVDMILFTVKMYDNASVIPQLIPLLKKDTIVLTLQNGVSSEDMLTKILGEHSVMIGAAYIEGRIKQPGVVQQIGQFCRVVFGEINPGITFRATTLHVTLEKAQWQIELSENMNARNWEKFIYLAATAGVCAATGANYGEMYQTMETRTTLISAMQEIAQIATAQKILVNKDCVQQSLLALKSFNPTSRSSMAKDFTDGKPVELEGLTGEVIRRGKLLQVPTPVNEVIYSILKPLALRAETLKLT